MNEFEQKISRQPLKKIPADWRAEILAEINPAARPQPRASFFSNLNEQFLNLFWPHPKAWAGLAVIWIFIFALNFSMRDKSPVMAEKFSPPSPEVIVELKKQQLLFAELMDSRDVPDADRQKIFLPKPRSERAELLMT